MAPAKTQLLQVVSPPPCLVLHFLAASSTARHHFCFAVLVLHACDDFSPPELHQMCPSVRVTAVVPAPPLLVSDVLPASSTPFLVAGNACPSPGKKLSPAFLVLHASRVTNSTQFAEMGPLLPPESELFPADGPHLPIASHTLLVGLHPLSPTLLVTLACVELPPCSGPAYPVTTGAMTAAPATAAPATAAHEATTPPHAVHESTAAMPVLPPDVGSESPMLGEARVPHPLVAAPGSVAANAESFAASVDGRKIGRKLLSGRFNKRDFGHHFFLKG